MAKHPRLTRRGTVYWFRAKVPVDLQNHYAPKKEITFSLRTRDPREALEKVRLEGVRLDQEFAAARRKLKAKPSSVISEAEVQRLGALWLHRLLQEDEELRFHGFGDEELFAAAHDEVIKAGGQAAWTKDENTTRFGLPDRGLAKLTETQEIVAPAMREALARGDVSIVEWEVNDLLEQHGLNLDPSSQAWHRVAVAVLKAWVRAGELIDRRQRGELVETPPEPAALSSANRGDDDEVLSFSAIWRLYRDERKLPQKTASDFGTYVNRFVEVNGDLLITEVKRQHVRAFKDAMLKMPTRVSGKLRGLTVPQIIEALDGKTDVPRLSVRTINAKALGAVSAVFGYAVENGYRDDNPATHVRALGETVIEPPRISYSIDDLRLIFSTPVFTKGERPKGGGGEAAKWLPLMALFTGARLEELGRLDVKDVGEEQGVPYLFLHSMGEGKRLKGRASRRKVPIHSELQKLGFMDYVEDRRKSGKKPLFPDLGSERTEVTAAFSKWWGRYIRKQGLDDKRKVFHSFRHLVKRQLRNAMVDKTLRDALQGHVAGDAAEEYGLDEEGFGISLPVLAEALEKLQYPGLDFSHLHAEA